MTYPDQPGGYDPYGQQPGPDPNHGHGQHPGYGQPHSVPPYQQPVTGVPSSPGAYGSPVSPGHAMGYPPPGYAPPPVAMPGDRPLAVTFGAMLIVVHVVLNVGVGILMSIGMMADVSAFGEEQASRTSAVLTGGLFVLVGLGFIALALGILRGRDGARVTAFVLYGLCGGCGLLGTVLALFGTLAGSSSSSSSSSGIDGVGAGVTIISLAVVATYVAVIVLLAMPVSNRWFKDSGAARRAGLIS